MAQEHIRPLIGVIDRLNEAYADELRVLSKQLTRLSFRAAAISSPNSRSARRRTGRAAPPCKVLVSHATLMRASAFGGEADINGVNQHLSGGRTLDSPRPRPSSQA
jgi:hypothetical protein